jgi:hypothetical protein
MRVAITVVAVAALFAASSELGAQAVETPAAFDSAGRVRQLTPALVARLELAAPAWPVVGSFREARLYSVSEGGAVLVVEFLNGTMQRHPLSDDRVRDLRSAVDRAMTAKGALVTESQTDLIQESASGQFVRNQMVLASLLYGPALATLANDEQTAAGIYLLSTGASYFVVKAIASRTTVSRTQNDLSTDGAVRGALFASGLRSAFGPEDPDPKTAAIISLTGALTGTIGGFKRARGLTDAEGKAAKSASTYAFWTALGALGMAGVNDSADYRASALVTVGSGIAGYLLGPRYPKRSAYTVTAGDINLMWIGSTLGVATAFIPFIGKDSINERLGWGLFTGGLLGGALLAERSWVRDYDHSQGDVAQIWLGTLAGGLMGGAVVILTEPNPTGAWTMITAGAALGAIASQSIARPAVARGRSASLPRTEKAPRAEVELSPAGLAMTATRTRGSHGLLTIRF